LPIADRLVLIGGLAIDGLRIVDSIVDRRSVDRRSPNRHFPIGNLQSPLANAD
jgi:hypothetical protein